MKKWTLIYYTDENEKCPVEEFIRSRDKKNRAKIMSFLTLLEEKGPNLPRPYADLLKEGIHELRVKLSGDQIRILYFFIHKDNIILTHAFRKITSKVPEAEIKKALWAKEDYVRRFHSGKEG